MKMTIKPLPSDVQSMICASTRINTYKSAIEELVYNALDAKATSIAIRLDIPEHTIQVIDNGYGITKTDMSNVGKKHMTSKTVDLSSLKSMPNFYGYLGQSLASIIEVSQFVKITSRVDGSDETLTKTFSKGKERSIATAITRPSKGTTVEVLGFLFNLTIQKKAVNPLVEQQAIKYLLQQLSLVHANVSISLRDNSNNNIIFQIHKYRDIYQTFSTIFTIQKDDFTELQVEKRHYKVTAYIGKGLVANHNFHWVYLNGKFVPRCQLHKILDINITKLLGLRNFKRRMTKLADFPDDELTLFKGSIPFYFVFIICPYNDYDISETSKTLELQFKDWNPISKILEKLVNLYAGDRTSEIPHLTNRETKPDDTRDEVKKIIEKILASNSRKLGVSQMQNGVKGKLMKRKKKVVKEISLEKVVPSSKDKHKKICFVKQSDPSCPLVYKSAQNDKKMEVICIPSEQVSKKENKTKAIPITTIVKKPDNSNSEKAVKERNPETEQTVEQLKNKCLNETVETNTHQTPLKLNKGKKSKVNILVKTFQDNPSIVKQRCKLLKNKIDKLRQIKFIHRIKNTPCVASQLSNTKTQKNNQRVIVQQRFGKIIIDENRPLQLHFNPRKLYGNMSNNKEKNYCKASDLLQTILKSQDNDCNAFENGPNYKTQDTVPSMPNEKNAIRQQIIGEQKSCKRQTKGDQVQNNNYDTQPSSTPLSGPKLTYESHAYYRRQLVENTTLKNLHYESHRHSNRRFITQHSKNNFAMPSNIMNKKIRLMPYKKSYANHCKKSSILTHFNNYGEHSCSIEFTQTNKASSNIECLENIMSTTTFNNKDKSHNTLGEDVYTINREDDHRNAMTLLHNGTYTISKLTVISHQIETVVDYGTPQKFQDDSINVPTIQSNLNSYTSTNTIEDSLARSCNTYFIRNDFRNVEKHVVTSPLLGLKMPVVLMEKKKETPDLANEFWSESQNASIHVKNKSASENRLDPLYVCETVLSNRESFDEELNQNDLEPKLYSRHILPDDLSIPSDAMATYNAVEETSHHFHINDNSVISLAPPVSGALEKVNCLPTLKGVSSNTDLKVFTKDGHDFILNENTGMTFRESLTKAVESFRASEFSIKSRPRYVPKGMSPIFENCERKSACHYDVDEDYFGDSMYDNFAKAVDANTEIFEANVDGMNDLATREINRINERLKKDNASLCFRGDHLRQAKIFGQLDSKFIAAKVMGKSAHTEAIKEYLVLFDQHAVHERIRLEKNLSEYLTEKQWKSVTLDNVTVKLKPDEILFLHNYRDKLQQLGLLWTLEGEDEISVTAIPEAILGKNARQVEIVMKAVKSLILEEIEAIKCQKGSISLYPKSIMDLVFSEACRYAIKFGDRLSYNDCVRLICELSECKTPFQCAHGRPVMAVLVEIKPVYSIFKIDTSKLDRFKHTK